MLHINSLILPKNINTKLLPHLWRIYSPHSSTNLDVAQIDLSVIDFDSITKSAATSYPIQVKENGIKHLLSDVSRVVPDTIRRLRRAPSIRSEDILELLMKFQCECEKSNFQRKYAESLWEIFRLFNGEGLKTFPNSWEIMSSILLRHGLLREVQLILLATEKQGIEINTSNLLCRLIRGYVNSTDADRALLAYTQMKERSLAPNLSCYFSLINILAHNERIVHSYKICLEMLSLEIILNEEGQAVVENVVRLLNKMGMVQEARSIVRKSMTKGANLSDSTLNEIAVGYCEKRDFEDLMKFLGESKTVLTVVSGNKIIATLCSNLGVQKAESYRLRMENNGSFFSNEITYAILVGWCCKEGKLKPALIYLSELLSRGLTPNIWTYNALLGGVFSMKLTNQASVVFDEMLESGVPPSLTTFRILIAGYCKGRHFELVKRAVYEMKKRSLTEPLSVSDPLSFAFSFLELDHLNVRVKRDNSVGLWKVDFYDHLGNGLYLDTNLDLFDETLTRILQDSYLPNYDLLIKNKCVHQDFNIAFSLADEMDAWGQELSLNVFLLLLKNCAASIDRTCHCVHYIDKNPMFLHQFDEETLGFLMKLYSANGFTHQARMIHEMMLHKSLNIPSDSLSPLLSQLAKKEFKGELIEFWNASQYFQWKPNFTSFEPLIKCLCRQSMLPEALELYKKLILLNPSRAMEISSIFIRILSNTGYPSAAHSLGHQLHIFVEESEEQSPNPVPNKLQIHESDLIKELCLRGRIKEAISVLDEMLRKGNDPDPGCYDFVIGCLCGCNQVDMALDFHYEMLDLGMSPRLGTWGVLVDALCRHGRTREAEGIVGWMRELGGSPSREMYCALIGGYRLGNEVKKAADVMHEMQRSGYDPDFDMHWSLIERLNHGNNGKGYRNGFISRILFGNH